MFDFDDFENTFAKKIYDEAYKEAYEQGRADGQQDGEKEGASLGAKIGSEIGYYRGYTTTWVELIKSKTNNQDDAKSKKILHKLEEVLKLIDTFPHTNETHCEEELINIRNKFKNLKHFDV